MIPRLSRIARVLVRRRFPGSDRHSRKLGSAYQRAERIDHPLTGSLAGFVEHTADALAAPYPITERCRVRLRDRGGEAPAYPLHCHGIVHTVALHEGDKAFSVLLARRCKPDHR